MLSASVIWSKALAALKSEMTDASYNTWIATLVPLRIEGDTTLVLQTEDELYRSTLERFYTPMVEKSIRESCGCELHVRFTTRETPLDDDVAEASPDFVKPVTVRNDCPTLIPKYTFDTFVTGESNRFSYAAALAVAENPSKAYNPLYIYGGVGLGKTHLMHAIGHFIHGEHPDYKILYISSENFTNDVVQSIARKERTSLREKYRYLDVLLIDDIQFIAGKAATQEEFFHTFNSLYENKRQIVLTSDRVPGDMVRLEDRLRTRFEWGLIVDVQPPDYETRFIITREKALELGIELPQDVVDYISENITNNVRQIEGTVKKIKAYHDLTGMPLDITNVSRAIKDMYKGKTQAIPTPDLIISEVCRFYSIDESTLRSTLKNKGTAEARQVAMYLIRKLTNLSLPDIAKEFGKNHTTVLYALKKVEQELPNSSNGLQDNIRDITSNINSRL